MNSHLKKEHDISTHMRPASLRWFSTHANQKKKPRQIRCFFYGVAALASAAASTLANDPSSASTVNHAMSLANSLIHAAGPDLWGGRRQRASGDNARKAPVAF
jgi:hypothetical protein